jgi:hypothetical protein
VTEETGQTPWIRERDAVVERMLAGGGRPGIADPALRSGKTGLELLQAMLRGELPFPPIAETLDFSLISVEAGKAVFQSMIPAGYSYTTVELGTNIVRAASSATGPLRARYDDLPGLRSPNALKHRYRITADMKRT